MLPAGRVRRRGRPSESGPAAARRPDAAPLCLGTAGRSSPGAGHAAGLRGRRAGSHEARTAPPLASRPPPAAGAPLRTACLRASAAAPRAPPGPWSQTWGSPPARSPESWAWPGDLRSDAGSRPSRRAEAGCGEQRPAGALLHTPALSSVGRGESAGEAGSAGRASSSSRPASRAAVCESGPGQASSEPAGLPPPARLRQRAPRARTALPQAGLQCPLPCRVAFFTVQPPPCLKVCSSPHARTPPPAARSAVLAASPPAGLSSPFHMPQSVGSVRAGVFLSSRRQH
ncbi:PREDICTED: transcription initiation factor TFIID subunit 4-like [Chinchilla lanigera]|uniref:transcription initiation factor TFIID subunit 4-like n=1 Tax=Chinchilla lanigera TaxID=34839 RepID=UPI000696CD2D|nr:PREDICTED: transcription initiation factor TFIID subunit 4-like [Chinchilla lanigera]